MNFKLFVCFNDDGNVREVCLDKADCEDECEEYIAKLIPITRDYNVPFEEATRLLEQSTKEFGKEVKELEKSIRKFKVR